MSYDPISYLGLSCKSGGDFHICQDSEVRFVGCCDIDPCGNNGSECPTSALHPANFDPNKYGNISQQSCVSPATPSQWYTCGDGPTFLGCCTSNPCQNESVCPKGDLIGAALSSNPNNASIFLTTIATTSIQSSTSPPTVSATSIPNPDTVSGNQRKSDISIGSIVGGILGGLVVLGIIAFAFFRYRKRRARATARADEDAMTALQPPWSPYHDSFCGTPHVPPASVSPLSTASVHHRSLSASLSSIIGFKRASTAQRRSSHICANCEAIAKNRTHILHNNGQQSPGFTNPVELEGQSTRRILGELPDRVYYEVQGSTPNAGPRDVAS
ncbi:hypothetical protein F4825DRAFT_452806 [Nemania diffusa]|nr:hypothetical protein F4825DRAFT_452806 [Nemania diffusa]